MEQKRPLLISLGRVIKYIQTKWIPKFCSEKEKKLHLPGERCDSKFYLTSDDVREVEKQCTYQILQASLSMLKVTVNDKAINGHDKIKILLSEKNEAGAHLKLGHAKQQRPKAQQKIYI